ncbi:MAG: peptide chain release factor 2 [Planctomycetales bacterium]
MEKEVLDRSEAIQQRIVQLRDSLDHLGKQEQVKTIEAQMAEPSFWDNQEKAQAVVAALKNITAIVKPLDELLASSEDLGALLEMAEEDDSIEQEVRDELGRLESNLESLELKSLLDAPHDPSGAILTINARDGGTDANDWAEMLLRMYIQWAQKNEYGLQLLDRQENDEAGINSATLVIRGPMAYGYLKGETGMHRLVRISPFNSEGKRQTSFASIDVAPEITDEAEIEINDADMRVQTYKASGPGGQHVNKTDSAVRIIHVPTNIVVQCQSERSQHKNRATAVKMLRARLARLEDERREAEQEARYKSQARVGFGSQIRNYFLHPDQRVKDTRTNLLVGNFQAVMDGDIQPFLDSYLRWRIKGS